MPPAEQKGAGRERDLAPPCVHEKSWNCWLSTHSLDPYSLAHHPCRVWLGKTVWFFGEMKAENKSQERGGGLESRKWESLVERCK